ncbi:H(+)-transporting V0 sector ATPase subunit c [Exophiala bonariae]|uniref:V-type proton ATPase proteolipid subunit n=1 Tax=Exophiala bonariae TaxID=1690606 RepID=A0AAV9N135_9EURO|nr:H(+)-transporting V0 sector ATPase subunit c [Exophiala bonariae]
MQPFFSAMGCATAIIFTCFGASYGTAKSGIGIMSAGIYRPDQLIKYCMPTVMAGIIAIYGLVISMMISTTLSSTRATPLAASMTHLGAGLATGLSGLSAGFAIGIVGDAGVRASAQQPRLYVGMILIMIFGEVLGLYGMIVGLLMISKVEVENVC